LYHYKSLADKPTLEEFYDFQDWHSSNIEGEVKQILSEESKIVSKISKGYKKALNKWRRSLVARIPTPNGLKYSGLFNAAGD
jgi:hypothetical protein